MKNFIKGALFIYLLLPILDGIISIYSHIIEFICTHIDYRAIKIKNKITSERPPQQEKEEKSETHAIGFQIPINIYDNEDDEGE